ncbi:MAG TPA: leucyl aminopeptidase [Actinomycetota bacterium]|nr:leucyl aminopeptidase [Actinomycetota bacterium]
MTTFSYAAGSAREVATGLLVVPVFEGPEPGPGVRETRLLDAYTAARHTGKKGEHLLVTKRRGDRFAADAVLLVGVGPKDGFDANAMRRVLGRVAGTGRRFGAVATTFAQAAGARQATEAVQACAEGMGLGAYRFDRYRSDPDGTAITKVTVVGSARWDAKAMKAAVKRAGTIVEAVCWARDLVNTPAGDLPPAALADAAKAMAKQAEVTCKVWTETQLKAGGFNGILGVGKGSANPPRMIELTYRGAGRRKPVGLVGKGITFDSGGLSLKPGDAMETMKCDMGGAAAMLATIKAAAALKLKVNIHAAIACSENMPSGTAQRPGDVITHRGGTTSEVLNTDAEGRLVMADALAYLAEGNPELIIDAATLTGACMVALGPDITGAMGTDDDLVRRIVAAGATVGEPTWQLPLHAAYRSMIESKVADIKNIGKRWGGAITAGLFLREFVGDTPWCHLDIAGPAFRESADDLGPAGATGVPIRTLIRFLEEHAAA